MRIITLFILCLFLACNTAQQSDQQKDQNTENLPKTTVEKEKSLLNTKEPFYLHLEGTIGDYPINMELLHFPNRYESGSGYQGYYYYQKYGEPIDLYGSEEKPGLISLRESDVAGNDTGNFQGQLDEKGLFKGQWISGNQKRTLPFELKPSNQSILSLDLLLFSDSLLVGSQTEKAPRVYVNQRWLYPKATEDDALTRFLQAEILKNMVGDSLAAIYPTPNAAFNALKGFHFKEYKSEIEDMLDEQGNPVEDSWVMNYDFSSDMDIYFLSPTLLTLGIMEYYFTGGAHGNYATSMYTYDLTKKREVKLEDLFKPGYEKAISQIIEAKARKAYGLEPSQPLSDIFFEDHIGPTENFGLTDKGIFFVYNPYEIAAYAAGEIKFFVAFDEVKEWRR